MKRTIVRDSVLDSQDPVLAFLDRAPVDDEPVTAEEERTIGEGWAAYRRGDVEPANDASDDREALAQR